MSEPADAGAGNTGSTPVTSPRGGTGEIFDLGYRSYTGARLGRGHAILALTIQSLQTAFGIGRGTRAKMAPFALLAMATVPAMLSTAVAGATGNMLQLVSHERYFASTSWLFALFCATQAPEMVGGDQQYRVLSLYFARALRRTDYVLAKCAALIAALLIVAILPHIVLFAGRAFVNENPWSVITRDAHLLLPIMGSGVLTAVLFASISLAISSVTKRRLLATSGIIAALMLSGGIAAGVARAGGESMKNAVLASPMLISEGATMWLFKAASAPRSPLGRAALPGTTYVLVAAAIATVCILALLWRYRRIQP